MKPISPLGLILAGLLLISANIASVVIERSTTAHSSRNIHLKTFPTQLGNWQGKDSNELDTRSKEILQLDEYLRRVYRAPGGEAVFVYIGYWKKQSGEHQAAKHSPLMCFPANGMSISSPEERKLPSAQISEFPVSRLIASEKQRSSLYYYWFFSGSETYREESLALLHVIRSMLFHGRSDGGIVEISTDLPAQNPDSIRNAEALLEDFAKEFVPALENLIVDPTDP